MHTYTHKQTHTHTHRCALIGHVMNVKMIHNEKSLLATSLLKLIYFQKIDKITVE